jgi:hypothetical protein
MPDTGQTQANWNMMQVLTPDGQQMVNAMALRHNVSSDAVVHLLLAIANGGGWQAQFNHPELGGMGQWSSGGMIMVGDMFNQALKYRVDALCNDLAGALGVASPFMPAPAAGVSQGFASRWPADLGTPSSTGSQNAMSYAVFPATRRLAIEQAGQTTVYDTGDHQIGGVSQQQGGDQSLTFTSQLGLVRLHDLPVVPTGGEPAPVTPTQPDLPTQPVPAPAPAVTSPLADEIFSRLERLADLCHKGVITQDEFTAKKSELLARL